MTHDIFEIIFSLNFNNTGKIELPKFQIPPPPLPPTKKTLIQKMSKKYVKNESKQYLVIVGNT